MKKVTLLAILTLCIASCTKDSQDDLKKLNSESQAVYNALWGQTFSNPGGESITFGNPVVFTDERDDLKEKSFKTVAVKDYTTTSQDLVQGVGFWIDGKDGYTAKVYRQNGTEDTYLSFVYLNGEERFDKIITF